VFVALGIKHAMLKSQIFISGLPGYTIFFYISHERHDFRKRKLWDIKCVFISSTIFVITFFTVRRTDRDMTIIGYRSSCKVPVILVRF